MTPEHRRLLATIPDDGVNEAMLELRGIAAATLDSLVAAGHLWIENRRYGARGNARFELKVRRFHLTPTGREASKTWPNKRTGRAAP